MTTNLPAFDDRVRALLDVSSDAMLVTTPEGQILDCNHATLALFGYRRAELIGMHRGDLVVRADERLAQALTVRDRNGTVRTPLRLRNKQGAEFNGEVASVVGRSTSGKSQVWVVVRDLSDRTRADQADKDLRDSNQLLRALSDAAFEAVIMHRDGVIRMANRAAEIYSGVAPGELVGRRLADFIAPESKQMALARVAAGDDQPYDAFAMRSDGTTYPVEVQSRTIPVEIDGGAVRVVAMRDLTMRRQLEDQLRQAQKLDAIGRLAGGIAHDFNNLLSVVLNATELATLGLAEDHPSRGELVDVIWAAERAAELTRQLLAFGRKTVLRPRIIDAGQVLETMRSMLRRLVTEDIELDLTLPQRPARLRADPAQLEQVVLNLVVNARDAMPRGGRLSLEVEPVELDDSFARAHVGVTPGDYVKVAISDTGVGMDSETLARIFEPFFTTKGPGHGTGLGLATVFGIVNQSGGTIWVQSEPDSGTTFTIYLPASDDAEPDTPAPTPAPAPAPGTQDYRILVVEDEPRVQRVVVELLRRAGYRVDAAPGPVEALAFVNEQPGVIDLLLTDVIMAQMSGRQLAERIVATDPGVRVVYMSGHSDEIIATRGVLDPGVHFLPKPIVAGALLELIGEVLAGSQPRRLTAPTDRAN
ncbi:sensory box histidine kinase/response regulator [Enhygromyxa salina]|uniref:histidine kinase n=1 Tax=Enhygromyxa salina TaxID=215803 RepID=A0A0C2CTQ5_9BACT|nr:PAS domain S-box protein [Enhygromyxa salina]KIG13005.1 sensory box histidine kinase/response regulator [Enhygromyxa salina]